MGSSLVPGLSLSAALHRARQLSFSRHLAVAHWSCRTAMGRDAGSYSLTWEVFVVVTNACVSCFTARRGGSHIRNKQGGQAAAVVHQEDLNEAAMQLSHGRVMKYS